MTTTQDPYSSYGIGGAGNLRRASDVRAAHDAVAVMRSNSVSETSAPEPERRSSVVDKIKDVLGKQSRETSTDGAEAKGGKSLIDKLKFKV